MNGVHDMGGMHGFGSVPVEDDAIFHADWERIVFAMSQLTRPQGLWNLDEFRHARERMDPAEHLAVSYFEGWLAGVETLLVEKGVVTEAELRSWYADFDGGVPDGGPPELRELAGDLFEGDRFHDLDPADPRFSAGDAVRVKNEHPAGHTRAPQYVRRCRGEVRKYVGTFPLPDAVVDGREVAEPCYSVRFDASELWNGDTDADSLSVDMWESYLDPA